MKKGMPKNACKCRAMIVEGFERPVKTAAGVSAATYKYETGDIKMGGEVQGKPHNMQLWTMTLDVLLQIHQKECEGITMTDPTKCLTPETNEPEEAVKNIQKGSQTWIFLAAATGQALAFQKSFWQLQAWRKLGGYFIPKPRREFQDLNVYVKDHKGKSSKIQYKHTDEPNEGSGLKMCPNAEQMHLNKVFLPKLGINQNMKRIAIYAPLELSGLNYPCMQTIQDQMNISSVLQLGRELATDIRICLAQAQLQSGFVKPILDSTKVPTPYLETGLTSHLQERLGELNGSIVVKDAWRPELQRVEDKSIMEQIVSLPQIKKRQMEHANQVRMWLRTASEIASLSRPIQPNWWNHLMGDSNQSGHILSR
ncbi:LOW QUALITY PROTEIN: hypothetical protein ACHAWO_012466 [Cyclotella atomus]|uniref:Uncharacterized protein n=1 Tax=Cyclotella atomus TaxID=382360 RepID=A0ABD3R302_9STRA